MHLPPLAIQTDADTVRCAFTARVEPGGQPFAAPASVPLLVAAEQAGQAVLRSACRNGTCRTCMCRLVSGQVMYRIDWPGLSSDEQCEGWILPCVAYPLSDLVIEAPL